MLKKFNIELPYDPGILLLGIYTKERKTGTQRDICTTMFIAALHGSKPSVHWPIWMEKQNVLHAYHGILFSLKKEGNSDTCYNMDVPWKHYTK